MVSMLQCTSANTGDHKLLEAHNLTPGSTAQAVYFVEFVYIVK